MLNKRHYIILILVVLLVIVLLKLPSATMGRVKLAISGLFLPLFGLSSSAHSLTESARATLVSKRQLLRENEVLRLQNQELQIRLQQDDAILNDNARLRALLGWARPASWKLKPARVIARDPANWWRTVEIDLGSRDGIKPNDPVLTSDGLVGRIQNVAATRAQVLLLGDPSLRVAAMVQTNSPSGANSRTTSGQASGETGVILTTSTSPQENNMVDLDYLSGNTQVHPGQKVVTWGEGGIFPPGIPIGKVVDLRSKEFGLDTEARVKLEADLGSLQEVWVMPR